MTPSVGSLFAGIGGFDIAAERAGMEVVWQSEIDKHASTVLDYHWPHIKNLGDIHGISTPPTVDVLTGGFPCQDYSVAGIREGLAGDRGALWWEYHRLIDSIRPTWVLGENVPGLLSSAGGRDFETIVGSLTELGYGVAWAVLDAQYFGVAQRRRRVFIVGHSGGQPRPEILALSEGMFGHSAPSRETRKNVAPTISARTKGGGGLGTDFDLDGGLVFEDNRRDGIRIQEDTSLTLSARMGEGGNNMPMVFNWQTGTDQLSARAHYKDALHSGQTPAVAFAQNQHDEIRDLGDRAGALAAEPGMKQQTYVLQGDGGTSQHKNGEGWNADDVSYTLNTLDRHSVANSSVRRLTPLECERLQGFPDGWTDIPGNSDSQRYRQLGNAVAVPVVEWILKRISSD